VYILVFVSNRIVIAGAGHAAGQVVATLKQKQFDGDIVLVGEEAYLPYQRPPLSKKFLAGELDAERLHFKPASFYEDPNIEPRLSTRVTAIDLAAKSLATANHDVIHYDTLVVATGSRARAIPVAGSELGGVQYLRSIDDVNAIREKLKNANRLVIIGAGYIGLEVAAVTRQLGLEVTVIEMADRVMSRVVSEQVSAFFQDEHIARGVQLELSTGLKAFHGDVDLNVVETTDGHMIEADCAIIGAGIQPNTELAEAAGLETDNGIVVDNRCRTSDSNVYAVGDCTSHPNSIYGRRVRLESVHNALEQAKVAAANACGENAVYSQVPWFWSDQYDLKLQIAGLSEGFDEVVIRGDPKERSFACVYLREGRIIAIDAVNAPRDFMQAKALIANSATPNRDELANADTLLKDLA
jgi:3-phenylpropionate/trans-cinnamate dioxygenase ferredoxin reductase component